MRRGELNLARAGPYSSTAANATWLPRERGRGSTRYLHRCNSRVLRSAMAAQLIGADEAQLIVGCPPHEALPSSLPRAGGRAVAQAQQQAEREKAAVATGPLAARHSEQPRGLRSAGINGSHIDRRHARRTPRAASGRIGPGRVRPPCSVTPQLRRPPLAREGPPRFALACGRSPRKRTLNPSKRTAPFPFAWCHGTDGDCKPTKRGGGVPAGRAQAGR